MTGGRTHVNGRTTPGQIWFVESVGADTYRSRAQQGWNAVRNADGPRASQEQMVGKMQGRKMVNRRTMKMATSSVSGIARNTTARGWKKSDLDRLNAFATAIPVRYTRD